MLTFIVFALAAFSLTPLLEYGWHAWTAHGRIPHHSRASHMEHHKTPYVETNILAELKVNVVGNAVISVVLGAPFLSLGWLAAVGVASGLFSGYVFSTVYHAQMHRRPPRTAYERWMWRFHFHHHFANAQKNFGLTNPIFDFVFGTAVVPREVRVPERLRPVWLTTSRDGFLLSEPDRQRLEDVGVRGA